MNFDIKDEHVKHARDDDLQKKCYPKRANNQMPYQKIEFELRKDAHWPPITNNATNHILQHSVTASSIQNNNIEKIRSHNNESLSRSNSITQLSRSESNHIRSIKSKHSAKLDDTVNFEMKSAPLNEKLIYEIDLNNDAKQISPNLNDQFTRI